MRVRLDGAATGVAEYEHWTRTVRVNVPGIRQRWPGIWRRYTLSVLVHELAHHVQCRYLGPPMNPLDSYRQELWCYRVQSAVERLLGIRSIQTVESAALQSLTCYIHRFKEACRA